MVCSNASSLGSSRTRSVSHLGRRCAHRQLVMRRHSSIAILPKSTHSICAASYIAIMASTETMTYQDNLNSQYLSNSLSSLSNARSTNSLIVRTYKQATQLYLTKRFREALDTLEPIITPQQTNENGHHANGDSNGHTSSAHGPAPVAQSSRSTRTKVWVFYLSLLNSIIELGADEGGQMFGSSKWKELASKVKEGMVWEEIVQRGYGGSEGELDADVVVNLATLLLGHMQDQKLNQQRLETYLATSDGSGSSSNGHLSFVQDGMSTPMSNSSSSPRSLATRLKILELYTLHVLPANGEWDYSRSFIEMNDVLDEERKEAFLSVLDNLTDEKEGTARRERELEEQREREMEQQRREEEEARRAEEARKEEERRKTAEIDKQKAASKPLNGTNGAPKSIISKPSSSSSYATPSRAPKSQKKPPSPPPTFYRRASSMLTNLHHMVLQAGQSLNSMALLRLVMFILAFLLIVARRDLRLKIRRGMEDGWVKIKQTIGMGVK